MSSTSVSVGLQNIPYFWPVVYNINGFNLFGIFLRNNILYQIWSDLSLNNAFSESIFIEIDKDLFNKNRNIIIGVIYRPPNTDLKLFNDDINELLDTLERGHNKNRQRLLESISSIDWGSLYNEGDTQTAFSLFHSALLKHFHRNFPKQTVKMIYNNRKAWLTQGLKDSIKVKNKLYKKWVKVKTVANETRYKTNRNKLNHLLKIAEKQHYTELLINC